MTAWRSLPYHVGSTETHIALSDALVRCSRLPTVWWHSTDRTTLILGPAQRDFDTRLCVEAGVPVVRRRAGGSAVLAGTGVLGLDVMLPAGHPLAPRDIVEAYRWLGEVWEEALRTLGVASRLVTVEQARAAQRVFDRSLRMACFGGLSPYEVTVCGRKIVGLAQVRKSTGTLLQAGIHLHFDAEGLAALLPGNAGQLAARLREVALGLDEATPEPIDERQIIAAVEESLEARIGARLEPGEWTRAELELASR